jgi:hypothetical protein
MEMGTLAVAFEHGRELQLVADRIAEVPVRQAQAAVLLSLGRTAEVSS